MKKYSILFAITVLLAGYNAFAAKVTAVKNNRLMVSLDGDSASPGDEFFVLNAQNKRVAIAKITQVKGGRAIADLIKGSAKPGFKMQFKSGGGGGSTGGSYSAGGDSYYDRKLNQKAHTGNSWGILGGFNLDSMKVSTASMQINMSGTGFGALGFYDYALSPSIILRGMGGMETYNVAGSNAAASPSNCTNNCDVKIQYLSFYGTARWNITQGQYRTWIGGGAGYLYPMSTAGTVFANNQLGANQIFTFSGGMDYRLGPKTYIPISVEYGLYPSTSTVQASIIFLRAGYAWNL